jgi:lysozyme
MKKIIFVSILLILAFSLSFRTHNPPNPKPESEELLGIDVSHYQGTIDWQKVSKIQRITYDRRAENNNSLRVKKKSRVRFCFIKATEGTTFKDRKFERNLKECVKYKIPRTGYHYYRLNSDPKKQAQNFINSVPKSQINLPPAIDIEYKGNKSLLPSELAKNPGIRKIFIRRLSILSNELEKNYKQKPIFYTTPTIYATLIKGNFPNNPIWISELRPVKSPNCDWLFWQTSFRGQIEGITKKDKKGRIQNLVDVNKFNGDEKDFYNLISKN